MSGTFFCCFFAVLRPLALLAVVRVAMGCQLYPMSDVEQTTIRAICRAESYIGVIYLNFGVGSGNYFPFPTPE